jgi:hypothetical protein
MILRQAKVRVPCDKCGAEMIGDPSESFCFCADCCKPKADALIEDLMTEWNGLPGTEFRPYGPPAPRKLRSVRETYEETAAEMAKPQAPRSSILEAAEQAVNDRHKKNDIPERNFDRIAQVWGGILNRSITPEEVGLMMIGMKIVREAYSHQPDNLIDIVGYAMCLEEITNASSA